MNLQDTDGATRDRRAVRMAGVSVALLLSYLLAVGVHLAPAGGVPTVVRDAADRIVGPWFEQQWDLFAPHPPAANLDVYARIRYGDGTTRTLGLSAGLRERWSGRRAAPQRHIRVVANLAIALERVTVEAVRRALAAGADPLHLPPAALDDLESERAQPAELLRRVASAAAPGSSAGALPVRLRTYVFARPLGAGSGPAVLPSGGPAPVGRELVEALRGGPVAGPVLVFDSGWRSFVQGLEPIRVGHA